MSAWQQVIHSSIVVCETFIIHPLLTVKFSIFYHCYMWNFHLFFSTVRCETFIYSSTVRCEIFIIIILLLVKSSWLILLCEFYF